MLGNLFRYEDDKLYKKWSRNIQGGKWTCCNDLAPANHGYVMVRMNGKGVLLHRLVYLFYNPGWNIHDSCRDNSIDHINGEPLDNRIENLRLVTNSQNQQNKSHYRGKPVKGVHFHKTGMRFMPWSAHWQEDGRLKTKYFKTEAEAVEHRVEMVKLHYTHAFMRREKGSSPVSPVAAAPESSSPLPSSLSPSSSAD